jgi:hypothetical protein
MRRPFEQSMDGHEKRIVSPDELYLESLLLEKPSQRALIEIDEMLRPVAQPESAQRFSTEAAVVRCRQEHDTPRTQGGMYPAKRVAHIDEVLDRLERGDHVPALAVVQIVKASDRDIDTEAPAESSSPRTCQPASRAASNPNPAPAPSSSSAPGGLAKRRRVANFRRKYGR